MRSIDIRKLTSRATVETDKRLSIDANEGLLLTEQPADAVTEDEIKALPKRAIVAGDERLTLGADNNLVMTPERDKPLSEVEMKALTVRNAEPTDKRLTLDVSGNFVMTNQPDNSAIGTAASKDHGTAPGEIPLNSDLGSASLADTGTNFDQIPLNTNIVYPVATVADLRLLEPTVNGQRFNVTSYYAGWAATVRGPTGGGEFVYDATDALSVDNSITVFETTTGGRIKRVTQGFVNPEMAGGFDSDSIQIAIDNHLDVRLTEAEYIFTNPVVIHDRAGLSLTGAGKNSTKLTSNGSMLLDTAVIQALGFADYADYANQNCFFMITEYDGENGRFGYSARSHKFEGFSVDLEGKVGEKLVDIFSSPSLSATEWKDIKQRYCKLLYNGWVLSDGTGNHFHLEWNICSSVFCVGHVEGDFANAIGSSLGTTWVLKNNTLSGCDRGYKISGINYPTIDSCSCDVNAQGSYAIDIDTCKGITLITPGVETRYNTRVVGLGGGILRVKDSSGVITGGFFVGGDFDELGTGSISDYGVTDSLLVIDNSSLDVINIAGDWLKDSTPNNFWPWYLQNGSNLRYHQGADSNSGTSDSDFSVQDTSIATVLSQNGENDRKITNGLVRAASYEHKGVFTPIISDASSGGNNATATTTHGYYLRNGSQVEVSISITGINTAGLTAGNQVFITGLPFLSESKAGFIRSSSNIISARIAFTGNPMAVINDNSQVMTLVDVISGGLEGTIKVSDITSGSASIQISASYEA